jgi:hypothetical protein
MADQRNEKKPLRITIASLPDGEIPVNPKHDSNRSKIKQQYNNA